MELAGYRTQHVQFCASTSIPVGRERWLMVCVRTDLAEHIPGVVWECLGATPPHQSTNLKDWNVIDRTLDEKLQRQLTWTEKVSTIYESSDFQPSGKQRRIIDDTDSRLLTVTALYGIAHFVVPAARLIKDGLDGFGIRIRWNGGPTRLLAAHELIRASSSTSPHGMGRNAKP